MCCILSEIHVWQRNGCITSETQCILNVHKFTAMTNHMLNCKKLMVPSDISHYLFLYHCIHFAHAQLPMKNVWKKYGITLFCFFIWQKSLTAPFPGSLAWKVFETHCAISSASSSIFSGGKSIVMIACSKEYNTLICKIKIEQSENEKARLNTHCSSNISLLSQVDQALVNMES